MLLHCFRPLLFTFLNDIHNLFGRLFFYTPIVLDLYCLLFWMTYTTVSLHPCIAFHCFRPLLFTFLNDIHNRNLRGLCFLFIVLDLYCLLFWMTYTTNFPRRWTTRFIVLDLYCLLFWMTYTTIYIERISPQQLF